MSKMGIDSEGTKRWRNARGEYHRLDGPAIEWGNGGKFWYVNNEIHRLDGPAVEWADGEKEWWVNDTEYGNFKDFQLAGHLTDDEMCILRLKYGSI